MVIFQILLLNDKRVISKERNTVRTSNPRASLTWKDNTSKVGYVTPEPKNSCWLLLWLVEDHTRTGNSIQKDVYTFMKQSYHVPIIRIVQQINEEMI